jgi:hypothetical protein
MTIKATKPFDDATALATVEWMRRCDYCPVKDVDYVALKMSLTRDQAVGLIRRGLAAERLKRMMERAA